MSFTRYARRVLFLGAIVVAACAQDVTIVGPSTQQPSGGGPAAPQRFL